MCHGFRLTKRDDYFWVNFDHFWIKQYFWRQLGLYWNMVEPTTTPPSGNLARPNLWNCLYKFKKILEPFNIKTFHRYKGLLTTLGFENDIGWKYWDKEDKPLWKDTKKVSKRARYVPWGPHIFLLVQIFFTYI